jgi:hypothetical protein
MNMKGDITGDSRMLKVEYECIPDVNECIPDVYDLLWDVKTKKDLFNLYLYTKWDYDHMTELLKKDGLMKEAMDYEHDDSE